MFVKIAELQGLPSEHVAQEALMNAIKIEESESQKFNEARALAY